MASERSANDQPEEQESNNRSQINVFFFIGSEIAQIAF